MIRPFAVERAARRRPTNAARVLTVEPLETRALMAVLTVGAGATYATVQAAVDHARAGDSVEVNTGTYAESVDLSRMGSAISSRPGNLTLRAINPNVVVASLQGPALYNSTAFRGDVLVAGITFESATNTAQSDSGALLVGVTGNVTLVDNTFRSIVDDGISVNGLTGQLHITNNRFDGIGDGATDLGISVKNLQGQMIVSGNALADVRHVAVVLENGAGTQAQYLLEDNSFTGDAAFFASTQVGVQAKFSGSAIVDLALVDNYFSDIGTQGIDLEAEGSVQLHSMWRRNVVQNIKGPTAADVLLRDNVMAKLGFEQNSFGDLFGSALNIELDDAAQADISVEENAFLSVGDAGNDMGLRLATTASATGVVRAAFLANDFVTIAGDGLVVEASGSSNYTVSLVDNYLSEVNVEGGSAAVRIEQTLGSQTSLRVRMTDNSVVDNADAAYTLTARGSGGFRLEGDGNNASASLSLTNEGTPVDLNGQIQLIAPGQLDGAIPQILSGTGWIDENHDGVRQQTEISADDVRLTLRPSAGTSAWTTLATSLGEYAFGGFVPGTYTVTMEQVNGYTLAPFQQGTDPTRDSDFAPANRQALAFVTAAGPLVVLDFGLWTNWQNPEETLDVDGDNIVAPIDALLIINDLNATGARALPLPVPVGATPPYLDTDGDNFVAPIDVLLVINRINENSSSGNGEGEASAEEATAADTVLAAVAEWSTTTAQRRKRV